MEGALWQGEPFALRLTMLRMLYKLPLILGLTLLGSLVLGGGYYAKNVLLRGESMYSAASRYRIEYAVEEEKDVGTVYINQMSWNTYLRSDMFLESLKEKLTDMSNDIKLGEIDVSQLGDSLEAVVESDLRLLTVVVSTKSPERSVQIAEAVEAVLTGGFAEEIREIETIKVIEAGNSANEVVPDVRVGRAFALSAVLSCFFAVLILLLKETGDDGVWLPSTLWKRYGLRAAGTLESKELRENMGYFFSQSSGAVAVCGCQEDIDTSKVLEGLKLKCPETVSGEWFAVPEAPFGEGVCHKLREAKGILLVVRAGSHTGRRLERVLEYLEQQDCQVTATLLWDADERLIRRYYFLRGTDRP